MPRVLPRIEYLDFAVRWFGRVRHDLATSGVKPIAAAELGSALPDELSARKRFVAAVAARYGVPESEVVPVIGASGALFVAYATLLAHDRTLLVETPAYEPLFRVGEGLGVRVDRFARVGGGLEPAAVLDAIRTDTALVAISNPHNPTGTLLADETIAELAAELAAKNVFLLVDEAYLELLAPAHTARKLGFNVVSCASATKCWGVPWARAGWLMLPAERASDAVQVERHIMGTAPPGCFAWGEIAVQRAEKLLERARRLQSGKRELVDAFLSSRSDALRWTPPPLGSAFGWVEDVRGRPLLHLIEHGIATHGVIVSPGEFFGAPGAFRMSWTDELGAIERGLELLPRVLEL